MHYNLLTILGPTAVGKTRLATTLAKKLDAEIISADSRQVYKGMDIGTGKDLEDYVIDSISIPYHLIDIVDPAKDEFSLYDFGKHFQSHYKDIIHRKRFPILAGGTGLYIHSILKEYELPEAITSEERLEQLNTLSQKELNNLLIKLNPVQHNVTDLNDKERTIKAILIEESRRKETNIEKPKIHSLVIGVKGERDVIKKNITRRLKERLKSGMIEEVEKLMEAGVTPEKMEFFGLEYKYLSQHVLGQLNYNDMFQKLNSSIHKFAKRQMTWFRKMEREGIEIHWLEGPNVEEAMKIIEKSEFNFDE